MIDRYETVLAQWKAKRDSLLKHEADNADQIASCDAYIRLIQRELDRFHEAEAREAVGL